MFHKDFQRIMDVISPNEKTALPIANDENKRLMEEIEKLTYRKERQFFSQNQNRTKVDNLKETFIDAEHDINQNLVRNNVFQFWKNVSINNSSSFSQRLIDAHRNQLADECLMYNIAQNTVQNVRKKLHNLQQKNDQFHEYFDSTKGNFQWVYI